MSEFEDLILQHDRELLTVRRINRLLHSTLFTSAYEKFTDNQKEKIKTYIKNNAEHEIKHLCSRVLKKDFFLLSIRQLRVIGQELGVPYFNQISKHELYCRIMVIFQELDHEVQHEINQKLAHTNGVQSNRQELG